MVNCEIERLDLGQEETETLDLGQDLVGIWGLGETEIWDLGRHETEILVAGTPILVPASHRTVPSDVTATLCL